MRPRSFGAVALAVVIAGASLAAAQVAAAGDDLPPLPPLPKPDKKAVFDLVVEGSGGAGQTVTGSGSNGVCDYSTNTRSSQSYEYGRGRNLRVIFSKYKVRGGSLVLVKREGQARQPYPLFTVKGSYEADAVGSATRSGAVCNPTAETVGDEDECGPSGDRRTNLALEATFGGKLVLGPSAPSAGIPGLGCGANGVETISGDPLHGWPNFPKLKPEPLPVDRIFGKKKRFKVEFESGPVGGERYWDIGALVLRSVNTGEHSAVVRFIRVKKQ